MDLAIVWLIAGLVLMLMEFVIPGFVIFFFGLGGIVTGVAVWLFPSIEGSIVAQGLCFAVASVATLVLGRRCFRNLLGGKTVVTHADADDDGFVGTPVVVTEAIRPPLAGRVMLNGVEWSATADRAIAKGEMAIVAARDNITLRVR